jgi:hypothetical protein
MCRNIKTLYNFSPPATQDEIRASALQFVRKLSGFTHPSKANEAAFDRAVDRVAQAAEELLGSLVTMAPPRRRSSRHAARYGSGAGDQYGRASDEDFDGAGLIFSQMCAPRWSVAARVPAGHPSIPSAGLTTSRRQYSTPPRPSQA